MSLTQRLSSSARRHSNGAIFRKHQRKGGIKVHTLYDHETGIPTFFQINVIGACFVVRGKKNNNFKPMKFIFLTNALGISPKIVAELYHNRWQIELFFKWLKQHLKIKKFRGRVRERREDPALLRNNRLLYDGNRAE